MISGILQQIAAQNNSHPKIQAWLNIVNLSETIDCFIPYQFDTWRYFTTLFYIQRNITDEDINFHNLKELDKKLLLAKFACFAYENDYPVAIRESLSAHPDYETSPTKIIGHSNEPNLVTIKKTILIPSSCKNGFEENYKWHLEYNGPASAEKRRINNTNFPTFEQVFNATGRPYVPFMLNPIHQAKILAWKARRARKVQWGDEKEVDLPRSPSPFRPISKHILEENVVEQSITTNTPIDTPSDIQYTGKEFVPGQGIINIILEAPKSDLKPTAPEFVPSWKK
ncbi:hypothetical protein KBC04_04615 [Candidatus Babeliales bacterium]|nr:hypothetical protein [Candidatus Babeliales bacterium]MBP9844104.1 hypothetical protein [Candidatus Babeliales bacterium]